MTSETSPLAQIRGNEADGMQGVCWSSVIGTLFVSLLLLGVGAAGAATDATLIAVGRALFHDPNLSLTRTQSCATCHAPQAAFVDPRNTGLDGAVSLGADGRSLGRRNAPTLTYAALIPTFAEDADGYLGGLFYDGRASTLDAQVTGPLHDPREMAMPDPATVAQRLREQPQTVAALTQQFPGLDAGDDSALYDHALRAIVAFERSAAFSTFDSKYDRFLAGEYTMTLEERMGREVFFSDLANCRQCHLQDPERRARREPFTNFRYFNIGVPVNPALLATAGDADHRDLGLGEHPAVVTRAQDGRFRVPTLRNVAVTGPYMHNGVFEHLETAVRFYGQYIVRSRYSTTNPETHRPWAAPEVPENLATDRLVGGQPLTDYRVGQLVAFLRTLTDRRYEGLLATP